jgi:carbohydrate diacid regulator
MKLSSAIAQRIIDQMGGKLHQHISVVDQSNTVLASTTVQSVGKHIRQVNDGHTGAADLVILPINYESQVIGSIVIHEHMDANDEIPQMVKALADLIVSQATIIDRLPNRQDVLNMFVYDLLHERLQHTPRETLQEAAMLGIDLSQPRLVVLVYIEPFTSHVMNDHHPRQGDAKVTHFDIVPAEQRQQIRALLLEHIRKVMPPHENNVYSFVDDHRLVALVVTNPEALDVRRQQIVDNFQKFIDTFYASTGVQLSAGFGYYYPQWQELAQSRADAQCALDIGRKLYGAGHVYAMLDLGLAAYVGEDRQQTKVDMARRMLRPLFEEPELLKTLDTFLNADLSPSRTADQLGIHRHTLSYRLEKIANLTGLNPRQFSAAAQFSAALLLQKIHEAERK